MPFLKVNGVTVKVAVTEGERQPGMVGTTERAENGDLVRDRVRGFTDLQFTTPLISASEAQALRHLVEGYGQTWRFAGASGTDFYGSKGKGPSTATNTTQDAAGGPFSGVGRAIVGATTGVLAFNAAAIRSGVHDTSKWHVIVWRNEGAPDWKHYQVSSSGSAWRDGASVAVPAWLTVTPGGTVQIENTGGSAVDYGDLVVLPYEVPSTWVAYFDAFLRTGLRAMPALGQVLVAGDAIPSDYPIYAHGRVTRERLQKSALGAGGRSLSFIFEEV